MTMRDKLIDILIKADKECEYLERHQQYPCEGCKYRTLDRSIRGCIFDRYADAIIESGLFCDISKVGKLLSEMSGGDCPCNYGIGDEDVADVINEHDLEWCQDHCDDREYDRCWEKFAEAKLKEKK